MNQTASMMRALVWTGAKQMELQDRPIPQPGPDDVIICVAYAGICGSELSGYLGHNALRVPPLIMGHEFSGKIVAAGESVAEQYPLLHLGQDVTANPMVYCGHCNFCERGQQHQCSNRKLISVATPGAFAPFVTVPAQQVIPLPQGVTLRNGALAEPVACAVRTGVWAGDVHGEDVLVVGAGAIGLLTMQVLYHQGASRVFVVDTNLDRLSSAEKMGGVILNPLTTDIIKSVRAATGGSGVSVSIDCVGKAITREQCVRSTKTLGTVVLSGLHEETSTIPASDIIRRELNVRGSFCYTPIDFANAVGLLATGVAYLEPWIEEAPLVDGGACFDRLVAGTVTAAKVLLIP